MIIFTAKWRKMAFSYRDVLERVVTVGVVSVTSAHLAHLEWDRLRRVRYYVHDLHPVRRHLFQLRLRADHHVIHRADSRRIITTQAHCSRVEDVVVDLQVSVFDVTVVVDCGHIRICECGLEPCRLVVRALVVENVHRCALLNVEAEPLQIGRVAVLIVVRRADPVQPPQEVWQGRQGVHAVHVVRLVQRHRGCHVSCSRVRDDVGDLHLVCRNEDVDVRPGIERVFAGVVLTANMEDVVLCAVVSDAAITAHVAVAAGSCVSPLVDASARVVLAEDQALAGQWAHVTRGVDRRGPRGKGEVGVLPRHERVEDADRGADPVAARASEGQIIRQLAAALEAVLRRGGQAQELRELHALRLAVDDCVDALPAAARALEALVRLAGAFPVVRVVTVVARGRVTLEVHVAIVLLLDGRVADAEAGGPRAAADACGAAFALWVDRRIDHRDLPEAGRAHAALGAEALTGRAPAQRNSAACRVSEPSMRV